MLSVYPYGSGSLYTASYALTASHADTAQQYFYAASASNASKVLYPQSGSMGKGVCLLTTLQYQTLQISKSFGLLEDCPFPTQSVPTLPPTPSPEPVIEITQAFPYNIEYRNTFAATASYVTTASLVQNTVSASVAGFSINDTGPTGPAGITVSAITP